MNPSPQIFQEALNNHQAGRLQEAERLYLSILETHPNHPDALHLLGLLTQQSGQPRQAIQWISRAIEADPSAPPYYNSLANVLQSVGLYPEALIYYRQSIALNPAYVDAYTNMGLTLQTQGDTTEAMACYREALRLNPASPETCNNLGLLLKSEKRLPEAVQYFQQAIEQEAEFYQAYINLGNAYHDLDQLDDAIQAYRQGLALYPNSPEGLTNLAIALGEKSEFQEALTLCRQAQALDPDFPDAPLTLANLYQQMGDYPQAITAYQAALEKFPGDVEARNNLGIAYQSQGNLDAALSSFDQALDLNPGHPESHFNRAMTLMKAGRFTEGWLEYEWRFSTWSIPRREFTQPLWDGSPFHGKTLLVYSEQGYGDAFQFVRYLSRVKALGGKVLLECHPGTLRLLQTMSGPDHCFERRPDGTSPESFDLQIPLMSLPRVLNTTLETIPDSVPYLSAPPEMIAHWQTRIPPAPALNIGLVWSGSPTNKNGNFRSCPLSALSPLLSLIGVKFYSLQTGPACEELANTPAFSSLITDLSLELTDFAETAAAICQLDLVISIDTSVAHLTGALGKPVFTLLPFNSDWRWLSGRTDSPWYPGMRLFRQNHHGDWTGVIHEVRQALLEEWIPPPNPPIK